MAPRTRTGYRLREPASSGPLYLAPVSPKSSKNTRFGREKRMFFELFADTGAKKRGQELAILLTKNSKGLLWEHARASQSIRAKIKW